MAIEFPGGIDDLGTITSSPDRTPLSEADIDGGGARRAHAQHHADLGAAVAALEEAATRWDHDHSGDDSDKPGLRQGQKLKQVNTHEQADTDRSGAAIHHTLGYGQYQAAPGAQTNLRINTAQTAATSAQAAALLNGVRWFADYNSMSTWNANATSAELPGTRKQLAYIEDEGCLFALSTPGGPIEQVSLGGPPCGTIVPVGTGTAPRGWLKCDGELYRADEWPRLFAVIGNIHGGGADNFRVPDLRDRVIVGRNMSSGGRAGIGQASGSATHTHTEGSLSAALGPSSNDWTITTFYPVDVNSRGPKTTTYFSVKTTQIPQDSRFFNHYVGVYGVTAAGSSYPPGRAYDFYIKAY